MTIVVGGLIFRPGGCNMQHTTALSFLLLTYSRYLKSAKRVIHCGNIVVTPSRLVNFARAQVYIYICVKVVEKVLTDDLN